MPRGEKLTRKQKEFCKEIQDWTNPTQAALKVYDTTDYSTAWAIASENLKKPKIKEFLDEHVQDAKSMIYVLSQTAEKEETRLKASQDIIDRIEGKATQRIKADVNANVTTTELTDEQRLLIAKQTISKLSTWQESW